MIETTSLRFAAAARAIGAAARGNGYAAPAFRSPPRVAAADRTLRRRGDGGVVVAIRLRGRPWPAVLADMIEGTVVANDLAGPAADRCRSVLWAALDAAALLPPPPPPPPVDTAQAGRRARAGVSPLPSSRPDGALADRVARRDGVDRRTVRAVRSVPAVPAVPPARRDNGAKRGAVGGDVASTADGAAA